MTIRLIDKISLKSNIIHNDYNNLVTITLSTYSDRSFLVNTINGIVRQYQRALIALRVEVMLAVEKDEWCYCTVDMVTR